MVTHGYPLMVKNVNYHKMALELSKVILVKTQKDEVMPAANKGKAKHWHSRSLDDEAYNYCS